MRNGIEGVLLKKGRIGFQQRYFRMRMHTHYLAYHEIAGGRAFKGAVDLAGPSTSIALSTDMKTLTIIGFGIDAIADDDGATVKCDDCALRTLTLRASELSPMPTLVVWAAQLRAAARALGSNGGDPSSSAADVDISNSVEESSNADDQTTIGGGGGDSNTAAVTTLESILDSAEDAVYGESVPAVRNSAGGTGSDLKKQEDVDVPMSAGEQLVAAVALLEHLSQAESAPTAALREASSALLERIAVLRRAFAESCAEAELRESSNPLALGVLVSVFCLPLHFVRVLLTM